MSVVFLATTVVTRPNVGDILAGMFVPDVPAGALITVVALIGTTVVPYNLFLQSSIVREKWPQSVPTDRALAESRTDTALSISIGGLITLAIVATAAAAFFGSNTEIRSAGQMAQSLEPLLGPAAGYFFALGLFAAGLTSAIAGPLGAAYAITSTLGWSTDLRAWGFRAVWAADLLVGTVLAVTGTDPVAAIVFAQAANGVLLPVIAVFLLVVMNRGDLLGEHRNGPVANVLGAAVVLVAAGLGAYQILGAFGVIG